MSWRGRWFVIILKKSPSDARVIRRPKQSKALLRQLFLKNLSTIRNPLDGKQRRNHSFAVCYFDHAPGLSIPNI